MTRVDALAKEIQLRPGAPKGGPKSKKQLIALPDGNKKAWAAGGSA